MLGRPKLQKGVKKESFSICLTPSARRKLALNAKRSGARSVSEFVAAFISSLPD